MSTAHWKSLTVQAFVNELTLALAPESARAEGHTSISTTWQKQPVFDFFASFPWNPAQTQWQADSQSFSLKLPVIQYFQNFQWNSVVDLTDAKSSQSATGENSFNIEDFSSIF